MLPLHHSPKPGYCSLTREVCHRESRGFSKPSRSGTIAGVRYKKTPGTAAPIKSARNKSSETTDSKILSHRFLHLPGVGGLAHL